MKLRELFYEMTSIMADMSKGMESYRKSMEPIIISDGDKIGEIESHDLYELELFGYSLFGLYEDDNLISLVTGKLTDIKTYHQAFEVNGMVTKDGWGGNGYTTKIFLYLKSREKWKILIGNIISQANKITFEKMSKKEIFNLKWLNIKTGETQDFSNSPEEKYNENGRPADWQILIEQNTFREVITETQSFSKYHNITDMWNHFIWTDLEGID